MWLDHCSVPALNTVFTFSGYGLQLSVSHLFAHGFWVGDGGGEEAVPLQSAIQPCPVIMSVPSVWQTPGNQSAKLFVHGIANLTFGTATYTTKTAIPGTSVLTVNVCVTPGQLTDTGSISVGNYAVQ